MDFATIYNLTSAYFVLIDQSFDEKWRDSVYSLFHELESSFLLISSLLPFANPIHILISLLDYVRIYCSQCSSESWDQTHIHYINQFLLDAHSLYMNKDIPYKGAKLQKCRVFGWSLIIVILYVQNSLKEKPKEPLNTTIKGIFNDLRRVFTDHPDHDKYTYEEAKQNRCSEFVKEGPSYPCPCLFIQLPRLCSMRIVPKTTFFFL